MGNLGILAKGSLDPFLEVGPGLMPQIRPTGRGLTAPPLSPGDVHSPQLTSAKAPEMTVMPAVSPSQLHE